MEKSHSQKIDLNSKCLMEQLITARKEIHNLRQQIKSLRYVHERDVDSIKRLLGLCTNEFSSFTEESPLLNITSTSCKDSEPSTSNNINDHNLNLQPIGTISSWFLNKKGTPRQPIICAKAPGKITLFKSIFTNPAHALQGLEEFSHMWILFHFHKNELGHVRAKVAPPRLNGVRTGVFSTRSPHRPCPIGLSLVKIIKIEDFTIYFEGIDMVDQTPVLDIKPYIPHYDNPLYIEKMLQSVYLKDEIGVDDLSASLASSTNSFDRWIGDIAGKVKVIDSKSRLVKNQGITHKSKNQTTLHESSSSSSSTSSLIDVTKDAEFALRLQAEEFQENLNFENVYINNESSNILEENELVEIIANRTNSNPISHNVVDSEINRNNEQNPRNSRLLDGADGPNAVCGTDLDLINRLALNLRLDDSSSSSSPIRMEVREAPDGEEGFDLSQAQNIQTSISTNGLNNMNPSSDLISRQLNDDVSEEAVRVPDWISRPKTSTLSVVFNERSILQLHEILNDEADEKRRAIENVLKEDPRSVYLRRRYGNQFYTFLIHDLHITCRFDDDRKIVTVFQIRHAGRTCECGQPEWQCSGHSPSPVFSHDQ